MGRLNWTVVLLVLVLLTACASAKLPPAPSSTTPLVEYSIDGGEIWHSLTKDETRRLNAKTIQIRQTEQGVAFEILAVSDLSAPSFSGSITKNGNTITAEGSGAIIIRADGRDYAKVILE